MVGPPPDQTSPISSSLAAQSGPQGFQAPVIAPPTQAPMTAPAETPAAAPKDSGGDDGFWGWVEHTAGKVQDVVGKVVSKVPGITSVGNALNRVYTDVVSHPISTLVTMANKSGFGTLNGGGLTHGSFSDLFSKDKWTNAWQAANTISPGQAVATGWNNGIAPLVHGQQVDPTDPGAVKALMGRNSFAAVSSGGVDAGLRTFLDPVAVGGKFASIRISDLKNAPTIGRYGVNRDVESTVTGRSGARLTEQIIKNNASDLPMSRNLSLGAVKDSTQSYSLASAYTAAGSDIAKVQEIQRLVNGDMSALDRLSQDAQTYAALLDKGPGKLMGDLHENLPAVPTPAGALVAMRLSSTFTPAELEMKSALSAMDPAELDAWFQAPSKLKASHAEQAIQDKLAEISSYRNLFGAQMARTAGDYIPALGKLRADMRTATPSPGSVGLGLKTLPGDFADSVLHPSHFQQVIHNHVADPIIRIYHTFTDARATKMVEFGTEEAVNQVRSLLNTSTVLSQADKDGILQEFASKNLQGKAASQHAFDTLEEHLHKVTAEHYGLTPELGSTAYHEYATRRMLHINGVNSRAYGTVQGHALFPTHDGTVLADPYLETQLARGALPMSDMRDFELAMQRMQRSGLTKHLLNGGDKAHGVLTDMLDNVYGLYKPLVMLTGHRAYNHVGDDLIRSMVKIGGLAAVRHASEGAANFIRNRGQSLAKPLIVRNLEGKWTKEVADLKAEYNGIKARYADQQERIAGGEKFAAQNSIKPEDVLSAKHAYQDHLDGGPPVLQKHRLGAGTFRVPGTNMEYPEIFGGVDGPYMRTITSADTSFNEMFDKSASNHYNSLQSMADHDIITPRDGVKPHGAALVRQINNQLRNDPVARMMYEGKTDSQVRNWMLRSPEGQKRMRDLHIGNPMDNIALVRDSMNTYLPTQVLRGKAFTTGGVTPKDIELTWPNASARPPVNGNLATLPHTGGGHEPYIRATAQKLIKITGSLPDDILVRHPMASALYKSNMTDLVKQMRTQGIEPPLLGSEMYKTLHDTAIKQTKYTMQQTLYDSSRFVSAGHVLRFVSPFYNAWHNAMTSWSHLIATNPQLVARGIEGKHALWNAPFAVDRQTGQQANDKTGMADVVFLMHMPKGLAKHLGMGGMNDIPIGAETLVSPTYADSVGSPGFGPIVAVPVNHLVKENPSLLANPFVEKILGGRVTANDFQAAIPSVATQGLDALGLTSITGSPEDVQSRATLKWSLYEEQYYDYLNGKRSAPPNWSDIGSQASWLSAISGIVNRLMPLGFKPQDQYKFLTDEYHNMITANGGDINKTDQEFYDKYGTAGFVYTQSLGKNIGGIAPTMDAVKNYAQYKGLIKQHPELAAVIVGPNGSGEFNAEAYQWEVANGLRGKLSPEEAAKQAQVNLGWTQFNKITANILAQVQLRGLESINDPGAKDLKALKSAFIAQTGNTDSKYYNPQWYDSFGSYNANEYRTRIQSLEKVAQDPSLLANPLRSDIKSLNAYFQVRNVVYQNLQERNSKSLKANENSDIANYFATQIGLLKTSDTKFGPLFERYLARDDLKEP